MMEKLHISPSEIDSMPYYEYEYTLFYYNEILEERQEAEKKNSKDYGDKYNVDSMQKKSAKSRYWAKNKTTIANLFASTFCSTTFKSIYSFFHPVVLHCPCKSSDTWATP